MWKNWKLEIQANNNPVQLNLKRQHNFGMFEQLKQRQGSLKTENKTTLVRYYFTTGYKRQNHN